MSQPKEAGLFICSEEGVAAMSGFITVNVQRSASYVPGLQGLIAQIDTMSPTESAYQGGTAPYWRYNLYVPGNVDIREGDLLIDVATLDTRTSPPNAQTKRYRVVSDPETFFLDHTEIIADRIVGNTP